MFTFTSVRTLLLAGAAVSAASMTSAQAAAPRTDTSPATVGEIVVIAEKRSERLQDVPIQVDVLTGPAIQAHQIKLTTDIVRTVPNFTLERTDVYNNTVVVLRGVSQAANADSPVAVLVDGVPQDDPKQFDVHLFDIAQIEVLKGPQGSLYGRNAEAGAVIITTNPPTNALHEFADVSVGNGEMFDGNAGISGAIVPDRVQFRLGGDYFTYGGLIRNVTTGTMADRVRYDWTVRGALRFILAPRATLDLIAQHEEFSAPSVYFAPVFAANANVFVNPEGNYPNHSHGRSSNFTAKFTDDLGFATLTTITGYSVLHQIQTTDVDFTPLPIVGDNQPYSTKIFSQELRLASPNGQRLRWLAEADVVHAKQFISTNIFLDEGHPATDPSTHVILSNPADYVHTNYGVSGQLDFDVFPSLTLTAGGRFDHDKRTVLDLKTNLLRGAIFQQFQPKLVATYKFDPTKLVYVSYSSGFRSGGFNPPSYKVPLYGAEKLINYEAGFKTEWLDRRLTLNGAVFDSPVRDYQFSFIDFASGSQVTGNIDRVKIWGAEVEATLTPVRGLSLFANAGYADPKIDKLSVFPQFQGNVTPRAAKWSLNGGFDFTQPIANDLSAFVRMDVQYYSSRYWYIDNLDVQKPKTYVNGSVGLQYGRWTASLWGKNIFNTKAYETYFPAQETGLPYAVGFPNQPATYGVEIAVRY